MLGKLRSVASNLLSNQETSAPSRSFPFRVAWTLAPVVEGVWSVLHLKNDPPLTRQMVRMMGLPFTLNIDRARQELRYEPAFQFEQGIRELKGA
jgi:nucleoside-diphosphate-sugar epimerase